MNLKTCIMEEQINRKKNIITRKIRLYVDIPSLEKDKLNEAYRKLYDWQDFAFKAANLTATNLYIQDKSKELIYLQDDIKIKLADRSKDADGILICSRENSTYRLLSQKFKNDIPSSIIALLNRSVYKSYVSEKDEYYSGKRSLRSYRSNIPVPFRSKSVFDLRFDEKIKNFKFSLFKGEKYHIPFRTFLGRDGSNNRVIIERCLSGEYKICDSHYKIDKGNITLYLVVEQPKEVRQVNNDISARVKLSFFAPMIITFNDKETEIGDKESCVYKRLAIQMGLKRRMQLMKYNRGGRGRSNKLEGVKEFKEKERNFIHTFTHQLSSELIKFCLSNRIGKLILDESKQNFEEAKEYPYVIRNWSFGELYDKIEYKCRKFNIELACS